MGALIGTFDSWNEIGEYTIYRERDESAVSATENNSM